MLSRGEMIGLTPFSLCYSHTIGHSKEKVRIRVCELL